MSLALQTSYLVLNVDELVRSGVDEELEAVVISPHAHQMEGIPTVLCVCREPVIQVMATGLTCNGQRKKPVRNPKKGSTQPIPQNKLLKQAKLVNKPEKAVDVNRFDGTNLLSESSFTSSTSDEMLDGSPVTFDTGVVQRIHSLCRSTYVHVYTWR